MVTICPSCYMPVGSKLCLCSPNDIRRAQNKLLDQENTGLTGKDYLLMPAVELMQHPDYSPHAMRVAIAISKMTTKQLEQLNIVRGTING